MRSAAQCPAANAGRRTVGSPVKDPMPSELGFTYRQRKGGVVEVLHRGRLAATLRDLQAQEFLAAVESCDPPGAQHLMARLTGNYKRGNERLAGKHPRNR